MKPEMNRDERINLKGLICVLALLLILILMVSSIWNGLKQKTEAEPVQEESMAENHLPEEIPVVDIDYDEICVLIKTKNFEACTHQEIILRSDQGMILEWKDNRQESAGNESLRMTTDSPLFCDSGDSVLIRPASADGRLYVEGLDRTCGITGYRGTFRVIKTDEGLCLINCLSLEDYLKGVIPSEMPSSWPMEALKAQAVCARTYACRQIQSPAYPELGAHLDDSTSFQVYHNEPETDRTSLAVEETAGQILTGETGLPADTYYYSTSCGRGTDESAWRKEGESTAVKGVGAHENALRIWQDGQHINRQSLKAWQDEYCNDLQNAQTWQDGKAIYETERYEAKSDEAKSTALKQKECRYYSGDPLYLPEEDRDDYEYECPFYRWSYEVTDIDIKQMEQKLTAIYSNSPLFEKILGLEITARGTGGVATKLLVRTDGGEYEVCGENEIRRFLCDGKTEVIRKDGAAQVFPNLLPSAFFLLTSSIEDGIVVGYKITGGGLGHGIGMSQSAAKAMAEEGISAEEILAFFYGDTRLENIGSCAGNGADVEVCPP